MYKPTFPIILLCLFVKYIVFFFIIAFVNNRFKTLVIDKSVNGQELFVNTLGYCIYALIFIFFLMLIFSMPIFFAFKVKNIIYFSILLSVILVIEYFIYTYLASQLNPINGVCNVMISLVFLILFFYRQIISIFKASI